jgi:hypothetical protein
MEGEKTHKLAANELRWWCLLRQTCCLRLGAANWHGIVDYYSTRQRTWLSVTHVLCCVHNWCAEILCAGARSFGKGRGASDLEVSPACVPPERMGIPFCRRTHELIAHGWKKVSAPEETAPTTEPFVALLGCVLTTSSHRRQARGGGRFAPCRQRQNCKQTSRRSRRFRITLNTGRDPGDRIANIGVKSRR